MTRGGTHGGVRGARAAAGEQEVGDVPRIERAVGNAVGRRGRVEDGGRMTEPRGVETGGVMVVHRPAAVGHEVAELPFRLDIALSQHVVPHIAAAFALAGEKLKPVPAPSGPRRGPRDF